MNKQEQIRYAIAPSALGLALVARSEKGVCAIFLGDDAGALRGELKTRFPEARVSEDGDGLVGLGAKVVRLIENPKVGPDVDLEVELDIRGGEFQKRVWEALREIPAGKTVTYGEIARRVGAPGAAREVGEACGANPLAVVIPCHRVVKSDGGISGYRWGVARKRKLLAAEGAL
jgi:AraC family transcriptional regulator of adaptative response/methylated-DNA-[protein]-cysteine methyltransferase